MPNLASAGLRTTLKLTEPIENELVFSSVFRINFSNLANAARHSGNDLLTCRVVRGAENFLKC